MYGGARAVPGTVVSTWFDVADIFAACSTVQSTIPQFAAADIFAVLLCKARYHNLSQWNCRTLQGLPFDVLAARIPPFNWEEFFARIPIQEQKETKFAYDAQQTIYGYLPRDKGMTIQKMLDNHPFGHLIAENMNKGVVGLTPVHVVHHIANDNGNEASLIYQLLHVEEEDKDDGEDMEEDEEGD